MREKKFILILLVNLFICQGYSQNTHKKEILNRIFNYAARIDTNGMNGVSDYAYVKYELQIVKRNILLACVPDMYFVAHGKNRKYIGEKYFQVKFKKKNDYTIHDIVKLSTYPHHNFPMEAAQRYITPNIYDVTIFGNDILSPFCRSNRAFYHYKIQQWNDSTIAIIFRPKLENTQLVRGSAMIEAGTGRIIITDIKGNFDMLSFSLHMKMNEGGYKNLLPKECILYAKFSLLGNKILHKTQIVYDLPKIFPDYVKEAKDSAIMTQARQKPLTQDEEDVYKKYYSAQASKDSAKSDKPHTLIKKILWDTVCENLVNTIRYHYGKNDDGYFRMEPLINPLYLGYSRTKGVTYKLNFRTAYNISTNSDIQARLKLGYSFKQNMVYYNIPITYFFNIRHNGYIQSEVGNGNKITNQEINDNLLMTYGNNIDINNHKIALDSIDMFSFKDFMYRITANYDFNKKYSILGGLITHRRTAVNRWIFSALGQKEEYNSAAPFIEIRYRPFGYRGPIIAADYERSIKGFLGSNTEYERWEFDAQYKMPLYHLQTLSMRAGSGFYTNRGGSNNIHFLDYTNFRENHIQDGWNDDWTGEFELLSSKWYNSSNYYIRMNATYESPIMLVSWFPLIGKYIEMERIYASILSVKDLHPYMECGYGIKSRVLSIGVFTAFKENKFFEFGCEFGFELFRHW